MIPYPFIPNDDDGLYYIFLRHLFLNVFFKSAWNLSWRDIMLLFQLLHYQSTLLSCILVFARQSTTVKPRYNDMLRGGKNIVMTR